MNEVLPAAAGVPMAVAHGAGLSLLAGGREELLYALHGLPSNKVYCAARRGGALYVGTLGGLAVLRGGRVETVWQADNSPLGANWITALLSCDAGLVVATYGGGVHLLGDDGAWSAFAGVDPRLSVNPNALCRLGRQVLAGTLDQGLWRLDPAARRGATVPAPLPSRSVQAIAVSGGALFVATDNGVARLALPAPSLNLETSS
jgi:ligand-binding sensor domain-containing protein